MRQNLKFYIIALLISAICYDAKAQTSETDVMENRNYLAGNWMLQAIENKNGNRTVVEYGENILIFDDILHMGCINSLKHIKRFSICNLSDYSIYALDSSHMKLYISGKAFLDGDDINKNLIYDIESLNEETLILKYKGTKAIYSRIENHSDENSEHITH